MPVANLIARRGDQHRYAGAPGPQRAQHIQAVALGQAQVEQHQVVRPGFKGLIGHDAVAHPVHGVVLCTQHLPHCLADHGVVFNQQ